MSDEYTYCVSNQQAEACITSNRPLTPAQVDQYISIDSSVPPGNPFLTPPPVPEDQPWYRDWFESAIYALDDALRWVTERSIMEIIIMVAVLGVVIALVRYARSSDLADDAYEAEDRIEDLNDEAYDRAYSLAGEISEEEQEE